MAITKIQSESLNLADDFAFTGTITGAGESNVPSFRARRGSNQSIPNNTQTKIIFDTEEWDTNSAYDNATGRFTVPSGQAGKYLFAVNLRFNNSTTSASQNAVDVLINGASVGTTAFDITGNQYHTNGGTVTHNLNAGDYVEVFNYQSTGGTIDIRVESFFSGFKISS